MITEEMDKSLILLANITCWPLSSMASLTLNQRKKRQRNILTLENREILERWLKPDIMVYEHFKEKFDQKVMKAKDWIDSNINILKSESKKIDSDCNAKGALKPWCKYYTITEMDFIKKIRHNQNINTENFVF